MTAAPPRQALEGVVAYYAACTRDYLRFYGTGKHLHMHYGLWEKNPRGLPPMKWLALRTCELAGIGDGSVFADLGCGVGGTSLQAAELLGARPVAVNLYGPQLELARGFATDRGRPDALCPVQADFHRLPFHDAALDAAISIESACHSPDKTALAREVFRVLKPGARWVLADGWRGEPPLDTPKLRSRWQAFLDGWGVPDLAQAEAFVARAREIGFELDTREDISSRVLPSARRIGRWARPALLWRRLGARLGWVSRSHVAHAVTLLEQEPLLRGGYWRYEFLALRKP